MNPGPLPTVPRENIPRVNENLLWKSDKVVGLSDSSVDPLTVTAV